jgi:hypothetical protein
MMDVLRGVGWSKSGVEKIVLGGKFYFGNFTAV